MSSSSTAFKTHSDNVGLGAALTCARSSARRPVGRSLSVSVNKHEGQTDRSVLSDGEWEGPCWLILMHDRKNSPRT